MRPTSQNLTYLISYSPDMLPQRSEFHGGVAYFAKALAHLLHILRKNLKEKVCIHRKRRYVFIQFIFPTRKCQKNSACRIFYLLYADNIIQLTFLGISFWGFSYGSNSKTKLNPSILPCSIKL